MFQTTRKKRSFLGFLSSIGVGIYAGIKFRYTDRTLSMLKKNVHTLSENQKVNRQAIARAYSLLNLTMIEMGEHQRMLHHLDVQTILMQNQLDHAKEQIERIRLEMGTLHYQMGTLLRYNRCQKATDHVWESIRNLYDYLETTATQKVTPTMIPPPQLRELLYSIRHELQGQPRLALPEPPGRDIWKYYEFLRITVAMLPDALAVTLTVPLTDISSSLNIYRVRQFPLPHPVLNVQYTYALEQSYLAIDDRRQYYMLPADAEVIPCLMTGGSWCEITSPLRAVNPIDECVVALFLRDDERIKKTCKILTDPRKRAQAVHLHPQVWALSLYETTTVISVCLSKQSKHAYGPPFALLTLEPSCLAYVGDTLYIPPSAQLTMVAANKIFLCHSHLEPYLNYTRYEDFQLFANLTTPNLTLADAEQCSQTLLEYDETPIPELKKLQNIDERYPDPPGGVIKFLDKLFSSNWTSGIFSTLLVLGIITGIVAFCYFCPGARMALLRCYQRTRAGPGPSKAKYHVASNTVTIEEAPKSTEKLQSSAPPADPMESPMNPPARPLLTHDRIHSLKVQALQDLHEVSKLRHLEAVHPAVSGKEPSADHCEGTLRLPPRRQLKPMPAISQWRIEDTQDEP